MQENATRKTDERKKKSQKMSTQGQSSQESRKLNAGDDLSRKIFQTMEKHRNVFFTILLIPTTTESSLLPDTRHPDSLISCDVMDNRDAFLAMAKERHWEFSSLRRAKYSTMAMLFEIHMAHLHPMDKVGLDTKLVPKMQDQDPHEDHKEKCKDSIEMGKHFIFHATQCHNIHCKHPSCIEMKSVMAHIRKCKLISSGHWNKCPICKDLVQLCSSHAKTCSRDSCPMPHCENIKKKQRDQLKQQPIKGNMLLQQRLRHKKSVSTLSGDDPHLNNPQTTDISFPDPTTAIKSSGSKNTATSVISLAHQSIPSSSSNINLGNIIPYINRPFPVAGPSNSSHEITFQVGKQDVASGIMMEATAGPPQELPINNMGYPEIAGLSGPHFSMISNSHVYRRPQQMSFQRMPAVRSYQLKQQACSRREGKDLYGMLRTKEKKQRQFSAMNQVNPEIATPLHSSGLEILQSVPQHTNSFRNPGHGGFIIPPISGASVDSCPHHQYSQQTTGGNEMQLNINKLEPPPQYLANRAGEDTRSPQILEALSGGMVTDSPGRQTVKSGGNIYQ